MALDEGLVQRLREVYAGHDGVSEKRMFGGVAFMVKGHMSCGVNGDCLMARVGPERYEQALARPHARHMDFTGKPIKGFVFVDPPGFESEQDLHGWVQLSLDFVLGLPPK